MYYHINSLVSLLTGCGKLRAGSVGVVEQRVTITTDATKTTYDIRFSGVLFKNIQSDVLESFCQKCNKCKNKEV